MDLLERIILKAMVSKRDRMKVRVDVFVCLNVKTILMELAPGYSKSYFLLAFYSHTRQ